jgi:hypothetical protein
MHRLVTCGMDPCVAAYCAVVSFDVWPFVCVACAHSPSSALLVTVCGVAVCSTGTLIPFLDLEMDLGLVFSGMTACILCFGLSGAYRADFCFLDRMIRCLPWTETCLQLDSCF